ncbi:hypothetical protein DTO021C3_8022 [Paecilomyces variotii]|nr:hypothetical protein DTO021C3_8022 [Paecilomyces variotii]KAJ9396121.1 hypothetical protein DTO282F9_6964 [Paecilomyces variotii]
MEPQRSVDLEPFSATRIPAPPKGCYKEAAVRRPCRVTFEDSESGDYINCKVRLTLDPQNPNIIISVGLQSEDSPCARLTFTVDNSTIKMGVEEPNDALFEAIQETRERIPRLFEGFVTASVYLVELRGPPIQTGAYWRLEGEERKSWDALCRRASQCRQMVICRSWVPTHKYVRSIHSWFTAATSAISEPFRPVIPQSRLPLQTAPDRPAVHLPPAGAYKREEQSPPLAIKRSHSRSPVLGRGVRPQRSEHDPRSYGSLGASSFHRRRSDSPTRSPMSYRSRSENVRQRDVNDRTLGHDLEDDVLEKERNLALVDRRIAEIELEAARRRLNRL